MVEVPAEESDIIDFIEQQQNEIFYNAAEQQQNE